MDPKANHFRFLKDYLIILTGTPRGGIQSWKSLIRHVKEPLNCDLALLYGDKFEMPDYLLSEAKFNWKFKEPKNWRDFYIENFTSTNAINLLIQGKEFGMAGGIDNYSGSGAIVSGFKIIIFNNYLNEVLKYKYIIHSRFDQFYIDNHPKLQSDKIWIPKGEDYYGICDRHAIFPTKYAKQYFGIGNFLNSEEAKLMMANKEITPESILLENLRYYQLENLIERLDRFQFTAATLYDETRWRKAIYKIYLSNKLMIKYPDEFIDSIRNYLEVNNILKYFKHPILIMNYFYLMFRKNLGAIIRKFK